MDHFVIIYRNKYAGLGMMWHFVIIYDANNKLISRGFLFKGGPSILILVTKIGEKDERPKVVDK